MTEEKKKHITTETEFHWHGDAPKCETLKPTSSSTLHLIKGSSIEQDIIYDPVKGQLWNLDSNKCLVAGYSLNAKLDAWVNATFSLIGSPDQVKRCLKDIEALLEKFHSGGYLSGSDGH